MAGFVAPQVVAVAEGLVAVSAHEGGLALVLFLDDGHRWPPAAPAAHIVLEQVGSAGRGLLV